MQVLSISQLWSKQFFGGSGIKGGMLLPVAHTGCENDGSDDDV